MYDKSPHGKVHARAWTRGLSLEVALEQGSGVSRRRGFRSRIIQQIGLLLEDLHTYAQVSIYSSEPPMDLYSFPTTDSIVVAERRHGGQTILARHPDLPNLRIF
jgi:hypothetical protein